MKSDQDIPADFTQALKECQEIFGRLSERNKALAEEWDEMAAGMTSPNQQAQAGAGKPALPNARQFGDSLLNLHEQFFENCRELLQARLEIEALRGERSSLQSELARFSEQVILLGRTHTDLSEQKALLERELQMVKDAWQEAERRAGRIEADLRGRDSNLEALADELARTKSELEVLAASKEHLVGILADLESQKDGLSLRLESIEGKQQSLHREVESLERDLGDSRRKAVELEHERNSARERIAQLETDHASATRRAAELEESIRASAEPHLAEIEAKRREVEELKARTAESEASAARSEARRQEAVEAFQEASEKNHRLQAELAQAKEDLEKTRGDLQRAHSDLNALKAAEPLPPVQTQDPQSHAGPLPEFAEPSQAAPSPEHESPPLPLSDEDLFEKRLAAIEEADIFAPGNRPPEIDSLALREDDLLYGLQEMGTADVLPPETVIPPDLPVERAQEEAHIEVPPDEEELLSAPPITPAEADEIARILDSALAQEIEEAGSSLPVEDWKSADTCLDRHAENLSLGELSPSSLEPQTDAATPSHQAAADFPYPEITSTRLDRFNGKKVLLVGGDERFLSDYEHLFHLAGAELFYFPSIIHLEKKGLKRHVRDSDFTVVFGRAVTEPGMLRMRQVAEEYSRPIIEHHSSGLVSLYHRMQNPNTEG
jgi:predicted  nucleic acid-binding Zn-ribbon protein